MKTSIYANLLYKLSQHSIIEKSFIEGVVHDVLEFLNDSISEEKRFEPFILIRFIRFIFEIYNHGLINHLKFSNFLNHLLNPTYEYNLKFLYNFVVLSNIPFVFEKLKENDQKLLSSVLDNINNFINKEYQETERKFNTEFNSNKLSSLIEILSLKLNTGIKLKSRFILDFPIVENINQNYNLEVDLNLNVPKTYLNYCVQYFKNSSYNFIRQNKNTLDDLNKFLISSYTEEIIQAFSDKLDIVIQYFSNFYKFFGINFDEEYLLEDDINSVIISSIFNFILKTFNPLHSSITYYSTILYRLGKSSKLFNSIINDNIIEIIINIRKLNINSIENFSQFLSFYINNNLINFDFKIFTNLDISNEKENHFINLILEKLSNLVTKAKVEEILKTNNLNDLNKFLTETEKPKWKYLPNEKFYLDTESIIDNIQNKKDYLTWTDKFESTGNDFVYIFSSCLFYAKSKTLSHLRDSHNFFKNNLEIIINSKEKQNILLKALFDIWGHSSVHLKFILEFLLCNLLVEHFVLLKFIFDRIREVIKNESGNNSVSLCLLFELIEFTITNSEKLLNRLNINLKKEQENLAIGDESIQSEIIKQIEKFEVNLDKISSTNDNISIEVFNFYLELYFYVKNEVKNNLILSQILYEKIVNHSRNHKTDIIRNFNKIKGNEKGRYEEIDNLVEYFENL